MTINGSKMNFGKGVLIAWTIFSIAFVGYSAWNFLGVKVFNGGVSEGQTRAVMTLLQQASKCEPFSVFAGENRVELINTACLEEK